MTTTQEPTFEILPLSCTVKGEVISSNLRAFCESVTTALSQIQRDLVTDADFGRAEIQVKALNDAESNVKAAKEKALAGALPLQQLLATLDDAAEEIRQARLGLEKQIKDRKATLRSELVAEYLAKIQHPWRKNFEPNALEAVKGKRTLETMRSALEKVSDAANQRLGTNRAILAAFEKEHGATIILEGRAKMEMELEDPALLEQRLDSLLRIATERREREAAEKSRQDAEAALRASQVAQEEERRTFAAKVATQEATTGMAAPNIAPNTPAPTPNSSESPKSSLTLPPDQERADFQATVFAAFAQVKEARAKLKDPQNQADAAEFALAVGAAWKKFLGGKP